MKIDPIQILFIVLVIIQNILSLRLARNIPRWVMGLRGGRKVKVYFFDDDIEEIDLVQSRVLRKLKLEYEVFKDQRSLLKKADIGTNVFVIDHYAPGMNGLELAERIKTANRHNWVIVYTGAESPQIFSQYSRNRLIDCYIYKGDKDAELDLEDQINNGAIIISNR